MEETYRLEFQEIGATRAYLAMIAQEEYAKAFMLLLIRDEVIPFSRAVRRAMNNHSCKQLVGIIMDYIAMKFENLEELREMIAMDMRMGENMFPTAVISALELLRYEKIGGWQKEIFSTDEKPNYDVEASNAFNGKQDRRKQNALYVRIAKDGQVVSIPDQLTEEDVLTEIKKAHIYGGLVATVLRGERLSDRYYKTIKVIKKLFAI